MFANTLAPSHLTLTLVLVTLVVNSARSMSLEGLEPKDVVEEIHSRVKRQANEACNLADIVFSLDSSGSIGADNWQKVLNFTKNIVDGFVIGPDNVQIGVNYYGNEARLAFHLNTHDNKESIFEAIDAIPWLDQNTNTSGGIRMMHEDMFTSDNGARTDVPWLGIVITDGVSTFDANLTIPEATFAKEKGIIMFAIGITDAINQFELEGIANDPPADFVFNADDFDALAAIEGRVVTAACEAASDCRNNPDLVILLDRSGSIDNADFTLMKSFISDLILDTNVDTGDARVGLVAFSNNAEIIFQMDTFNNRDDMVASVLAVPYEGGTTNTADAIRVTREQLFRAENGDRANVANTILLFTDGGSTDMEAALEQARLAKLEGVTIIAAAVGNWVDMREVRELASDPDAGNVIAADYEFLGTIQNSLKRAVCNDINDCPGNNPCSGRGVCVDAVNTYYCLCNQGFAGTDCQYTCEGSGDVALLLDSSASMGETEWYDLLQYAKMLARNLNLNSTQMRLAVATYANDARVRFNLDEYDSVSQIVDALSYVYMDGRTDTANMLRVLRNSIFTAQNGDRAGVRNYGILVTDGLSDDRVATFEEAATVHAEGTATMLGVGVNVKGVHAREELQGITSDPDDMNYEEVNNVNSLTSVTQAIIEKICDAVDDCSPNPCRNNGICRDRLNGYTCECPSGFSGTDCERGCDGTVDVAFVIDSSGSINRERFELVKQFIQAIVSELEIAPGRTYVGVITFGDDAVLRIPLNDYTTKEDILHAIQLLPFSAGRTNTQDALRMARDELFTEARGDRSNVADIVVLFTDGQSNVDEENTLPMAASLRLSGAHIIVASVENSVNNLEIRGIASVPQSQSVFNAARYSNLPEIIDSIVQAACDDVDECAGGPCQNGAACVNAFNRFICLCDSVFTGATCDRECSASLDIALVLDATESIDFAYDVTQQLARRIVEGLNFASSRTRVAVVTYQVDATVRFELDTYTTREETLNAMYFSNEPTITGTDTSNALQMVIDDVFSAANGDRVGVTNVAIVISDGLSNIDRAGTQTEAARARGSGIRLMSVALGADVNFAEINGIASDPDTSNVFTMASVSDLDATADAILDELCRI